MLALFMVNTVNAQDLNEEHNETAVGAVPGALKLWLCGGMTLGIVSVIMAIWSYVDVWARHGDVKNGPVGFPFALAFTHPPPSSLCACCVLVRAA